MACPECGGPIKTIAVGSLENTGNPRHRGFTPHVVDRILCPPSLSVADGDGRPEVVAPEHDPFKPYKSRCRLSVYNFADAKGPRP